MASISKLDYLKRYMNKDERHDFKMKRKVKEKVLANMEMEGNQNTDGDSKVSGSSSSNVSKKVIDRKSSVKKRHDSDSDESPPRNNLMTASRAIRQDPATDLSPPRRLPTTSNSKHRHDSDSDHSPPRKNISKQRHDSESDQSPPRKKNGNQRHDSDSDQSPPRKTARKDSDSDQSPPRRGPPINSPNTSKRRDKPSRFSRRSQSPSFNKEDKKSQTKATKTMSGATAGLSSAAEMKREAKMIREKEDKSFQRIGDEVLGRNAKTVMRDKETGKRRNMDREKEEDEEKERKKDEQKAKYDEWGKGLSQQAEREKRLADQVHEASKPLARYKDDTDLDNMLRKEERAEDPMLAFIQRKRVKEDAKNPSAKPKKELPKYKGTAAPPPNRFNILPGYRWDGVDRSNGFESKLFANISNKKAVQEMAYKWSTEDM